MLSVGATSSTALSVLRLIAPNAGQPSANVGTAIAGTSPSGKSSMLPAVSDAIMRIGQILREQQAAETASTSGGGAMQSGPRIAVDDLPPAAANIIKSQIAGATTVSRQTAPDISQQDFEKLVLDTIGTQHKDDASFQAALQNGTLKIQRELSP